MTGTLRQRTIIARAATIALGLCGLVVGYWLGIVVALRLAENWLDQYSKLMVVQQDAAAAEAHDLLTGLKSSPYPSCSDAEINYLRQLVFKSQYLKDAGRIHDGKIDCSATAGRSQHAVGQFRPDSTQPDGTIAYKNLMPVPDSTLQRIGLQLGTAYVVMGSNAPPSVGPFPIELTVTMLDSARQPAMASQSGKPDLTIGGNRPAGRYPLHNRVLPIALQLCHGFDRGLRGHSRRTGLGCRAGDRRQRPGRISRFGLLAFVPAQPQQGTAASEGDRTR